MGAPVCSRTYLSFFFQAEDGIRDRNVTGVQTCALPILIFIGTPIFQASIPGTLKNLFDLLPADGFRDKTVGLVVTAGSLRHYLVAEQQLKPILSYMKANIVQSYVYITDLDFSKEGIESDDILLRLDNLIDSTFNVASAQQKVIQEYSDSF